MTGAARRTKAICLPTPWPEKAIVLPTERSAVQFVPLILLYHLAFQNALLTVCKPIRPRTLMHAAAKSWRRRGRVRGQRNGVGGKRRQTVDQQPQNRRFTVLSFAGVFCIRSKTRPLTRSLSLCTPSMSLLLSHTVWFLSRLVTCRSHALLHPAFPFLCRSDTHPRDNYRRTVSEHFIAARGNTATRDTSRAWTRAFFNSFDPGGVHPRNLRALVTGKARGKSKLSAHIEPLTVLNGPPPFPSLLARISFFCLCGPQSICHSYSSSKSDCCHQVPCMCVFVRACVRRREYRACMCAFESDWRLLSDPAEGDAFARITVVKCTGSIRGANTYRETGHDKANKGANPPFIRGFDQLLQKHKEAPKRGIDSASRNSHT